MLLLLVYFQILVSSLKYVVMQIFIFNSSPILKSLLPE